MKTNNENVNYRINNFLFHSLPSGEIVVQSKKGVTKIYNNNMIDVIKEFDSMCNKKVTENYFTRNFQENYLQAIEFLMENHIIQKEEPYNLDIKNIVIISNCERVNQLLKDVIDDEYSRELNIYVVDFNNIYDETIPENSLILVFLNPYMKNILRRIIDILKNKENVYMLTSYIYNNTFYIDCIYSHKWKNPCHFCHMGYIESTLRSSNTGNITYQQLIDLIYHEDPLFEVETLTTRIQELNIITKLASRVKKIVSNSNGEIFFPDEIHNCYLLDLETFKDQVDTSIHWELCDCYE